MELQHLNIQYILWQIEAKFYFMGVVTEDQTSKHVTVLDISIWII